MKTLPIFEIIIRGYCVSDAPAIASISAELGYPATSEQIANRYNALMEQAAMHSVYVAELPETSLIVGWVHIYGVKLLESDGYAEIGGLVVCEAFRRRGIGRALIAATEKWAAENSYTNVRLRSGMQRRDEAHLFYEGIGYAASKQSIMFKKDIEIS
jgi:GNAT superfamily N-acetyltransferase